MRSALARHARANAVAYVALFVALGGTSYAAVTLQAGSVGTVQLADKAVTRAKLAANAITSSKVRNGSLTVRDFRAGSIPAGGKGDPGPTGAAGPKGDPGSGGGRAYGYVDPASCAGGPPAVCAVAKGKNIVAVENPAVGIYCITVGGIGVADAAAMAGVNNATTAAPTELTAATISSAAPDCAGPKFEVVTKRVGNAASVDATVGFWFLVP